MTWLITGGSGQLGTAITRELSSRGLQFEAYGKKELNISEHNALSLKMNKLEPKVIVNCAAWTDVDSAETHEQLASKVNCDGAENLALAAKQSGAKLIHISTDYVFSGDTSEPWGVDDKTNPQSAYGRTKAKGEQRVVERYPQNSTILRTAWLYSPFGKNFAKTILRFALSNTEEVRVVSDQVGQPTSATDLAHQIINLGSSNTRPGIYHATNSGQATWFEFAQAIFSIVGADVSRVIPVLTSEFPRPAKRPAYSVLGHDAWTGTSVPAMRNWKIALEEAMPAIISAVKAEG
jgi:dTDP-4-dehydrorhamnose reductase